MSSPAAPGSPARPGVLWRAAAGAWHVPAGLGFLLARPRLWPLAALPVVVTVALLAAGFVTGLFALPFVDDLLGPERAKGIPGVLVAAAFYLGLPAAGLLLGLALALLFVAPLLDRLSQAVEAELRGRAVQDARGLTWEIVDSLRAALYFAVRTPFILLVGLVPMVGPPLSAVWGAHALAFQMTESMLARRSLDFWARRQWHRHHRAESMGFGLVGIATLFIPLANLLLAPMLAVGATRLVLELEAEKVSS